ncbi:MAG: M36 family metallopeptidase, partial [Candidatus Solibacter usitatus]|nr:M36 family metallopeptidase [Candidatus Solibacter usitatus]
NGVLQPAWVFSILDEDGVSRYSTVVDSASQIVLARHSQTVFQSPRGLVFERESPQPNPVPGVRPPSAPPLVERTMQPFTGDPAGSPRGWVSGAGTAGNNAIAGANYLGVSFLRTPATASAANGEFRFPLELGPAAPNPIQFTDAATTNLFYWVNRAHDLFYPIGFDEASGNFQQENLSRAGVGGDAVLAYSHFGAKGNVVARLNNAFFSWRSTDDGSQPMIAMYLATDDAGTFFTDGSYDAGVILHEYTHGVSARLCRRVYEAFQGASMGEAWSDFFAAEFLTPEGAPVDGAYTIGDYFQQTFGLGIRTRQYSTNMEVNPLTFQQLGRVISFPEVHSDGEIWFEALWEMRANLIRQFGEREGRRRGRLLTIDGMKLAIPAPTMVDARDAILLADRVDFGGASQDQIWAAFAKRGMGVLAWSTNANSTHVVPSFERPSPTGSLRFYEEAYTLGETVRVILQDSNATQPTVRIQLTGSSGDVEDLVLRRAGSAYVGTIPSSSSGVVTKLSNVLDLVPGDLISAYYVDQDTGGGPKLIEATVPTSPSYALQSSPPGIHVGRETPLNLRAGVGAYTRVQLPFPFRFFGKEYLTALVFANGFVAFDLPPSTPCSDPATLPLFRGIAPLWMNLSTAGIAQPGENVYRSQRTPDSITFRWAAETLTAGGVPPEPVNFAVTLWSDGRIEMQYGGGNRNLSGGPRFFGCPVSTPTVGISSGTETFSVTVSPHNGRPNLENANSLIWEPPFNNSSVPELRLESPAAEERFKGVIPFRGVVYDSGTFISRMDVLIDGLPSGRLGAGVPRPDVCAPQPLPGCPFVGFSSTADAGALNLAPGAHIVQIRVTNARGAYKDFPEAPVTFHVDPGQSRLPSGKIEAPAEGAEVTGRVPIRGYVLAQDLRVLALEVMVDGLTWGPATYNQRRDDICTTPGPAAPPNCPFVGFTYLLNTTGFPPVTNGRHTVQIRVRDETGRLTLVPDTPLAITVNNPAAQTPQGVLTTPVNNQRLSGTVRISGHAWTPGGRIDAVLLLVDGASFGLAQYGQPRPEACATLPDVAACPNIGFELDFDTRRVPNGPHTLSVFLIDDKGQTAEIPKVVYDGINVFVNNP